MLPQEYEIARVSPNQLEIKPNSPALAPQQFPVTNHTREAAWLPLVNYRDSLRHTLKYIGTPISAQELEESFMHPISSRDESGFPGFY